MKGLEWEEVILHSETGSFPHTKSTQAEIEDERRLFYVGVTRARERLTLTWSTKPCEFVLRYVPEAAKRVQESA